MRVERFLSEMFGVVLAVDVVARFEDNAGLVGDGEAVDLAGDVFLVGQELDHQEIERALDLLGADVAGLVELQSQEVVMGEGVSDHGGFGAMEDGERRSPGPFAFLEAIDQVILRLDAGQETFARPPRVRVAKSPGPGHELEEVVFREAWVLRLGLDLHGHPQAGFLVDHL